MNHTYRVIYNESTNTFVAVSEIVSAKGKKSKGKKSARNASSAVVAAAAVVGAGGTLMTTTEAEAAVVMGATSGASVQISGAVATGNSIAIGNTAISRPNGRADVDGEVVIGANARGDDDAGNSAHIWYNNPESTSASVTQNGSQLVAVRGTNTALFSSVVTIGRNSNADGGGVAIGDRASVIAQPNVNASGTDKLRSLGVAIGANAMSRGGGVVIGASAETQGINSIAMGRQAVAKGEASQAFGVVSAAVGNGSLAMGQSATSRGDRSIAIGMSQSSEQYTSTTNVQANGTDSIAIGSVARAESVNTTAIGTQANATGTNSIAIGREAKTLSYATRTNTGTGTGISHHAIAMGDSANAMGNRTIAIGEGAKTVLNGTSVASGGGTVTAYTGGVGTNHVFYENPYSTMASAASTAAGSTEKLVVKEADKYDTRLQAASIAIGSQSSSSGGGVAIGDNANVTRNETGESRTLGVAIGANAMSRGGGVVMGSSAETQGINSIAIGRQAVAKGSGSQAYGVVSAAVGDGSLAMGQSATSIGERSIAIGMSHSKEKYDNTTNVYANGTDSISIGSVSRTTSNDAIALGSGAKAGGAVAGADSSNATTGLNATAIGKVATATHNDSIAVGTSSNATATSAIAMGKQSNATTVDSIAIGVDAKANGRTGVAVASVTDGGRKQGAGQIVIGNNASAIGSNATTGANANVTTGQDAIVIGTNASTVQSYDISIGAESKIARSTLLTHSKNSGIGGRPPSVALGYNATSQGVHGDTIVGSHARNSLNTQFAIAQSTAIGSRAFVYGDQAMAFGADTSAAGNASVAIGGDDIDAATAVLKTSIDELRDKDLTKLTTIGSQLKDRLGNETAAANLLFGTGTSTIVSEAKYIRTTAGGDASIAMGATTQSLGVGSLAQGVNAITFGNATIAQGVLAHASGENSIATGSASRTSANNSIAIGHGARAGGEVDASGKIADNSKGARAIAIGRDAVASGNQSISVGYGNQVSGDNSGAFGDPSIISGSNSYSVGNNNIIANNTDNAISIGGQNNIGGTGTRDTAGVVDTSVAVTNAATGANRSMVIGYKNTVNADDVMVLGNNITASGAGVAGSVILGQNASTTGSHPIANVTQGTVNGITYGNYRGTVKDTGRFVSVGAVGDERKIINVAAGNISRNSTEAINGSQLYLTQQALGNVAQTTAENFGGDVKVGADGNLTKPSYTVQYANDTTYNRPSTSVGNAITNLNSYVNQGWQVLNGADAVRGTVTPGDKVKFVGEGGTTVTVDEETTAGVTTVRIAAPAPTNGAQPTTITQGDNVKVEGSPTEGYKISANNTQATVTSGTGITVAPGTANENGTINYTVSANTNVQTSPNDAGDVKVDGNTGDNLVNGTTLVNTVNNASFNLTTGGNTATAGVSDKVKAGSTVTISGGNATSVSQKGTEITINTKYDNKTITTTPTGDLQVANTTLAQPNTPPNVVNQITTPTTENTTKFVNAGDLATTLNNLGFNVDSAATEDGTVSGNAKTAVKTGETVKFVAGKDIDIKQDGKNFTISAKVPEVANTTLTVSTGPTEDNKNAPAGKIEAPTEGDKLVNATTVANAINSAGWQVAEHTADKVKHTVTAGDKVVFANGTGTTASVSTTDNVTTVTYNVNTATKPNINDKGSVDVPDTNGGDFVNATTLAETINGVSWTAKRGESVTTNKDEGDADSKIAAGDSVTFVAGKNMALQKDGEKFIYATKDDVTFSNVTATNITVPTTPAQPGTDAKPVTINANGISAGDKPITNVSSALTNYADAPRTTLANLSTAPATNAATVGDLQRMGWIVSSDKTTGDLTNKFENAVTNAKEVKFIGTGAATVSGKLDGETNTITVHVDEADAGLTAGNIYVNDGTDQNNSDPSKPVGTVSPDTTTGTAATVEDVANAVNNSGFTVTGNGENTTLVNAGDKVDFTNGTGTTASVITKGNVTTVKFDVNTATKPNINDKGSVDVPDTNGGDFVNATTLAETINGVSWTAKRGESVTTNKDEGDADSKIAAGDSVTFVAGKNMALQKDGEKFIYATKDDVTFSNVTATNITVPTTPAQPGTDAKPVTINANGISAGDKPITNVSSALTNYADAPRTTLANLSTAPATNAATVGDLQRMGWIVSSDKTTGDLTNKFENAVTNAKEVKFIGTGAATVSGKLDGETNTITVHVDEADAGLTAGNIYVNDGTDQNNSDPSKPVGTVSPDTTTGTAATVEDVANAVNNSGFTVTGNGENTTLVNAGDKVDFTNGTGTTASVITKGNVTTVKFDVNTATKPNINDKGSVDVPDTNGGDFVNATTLAETINGVSWTAKRGESVTTNKDEGDADSKIAAGDSVTFVAGKNMALQKDGEKFIYATKDDVTFSNVTATNITVPTTPAQPGTDAKPVTINANGISAGDKPITNVSSALTNYADAPRTTLANLSTAPATNAATVGDLQRMGWIVSSDKTTGDLTNKFENAVTNAKEVKFIGTGAATVSGKLDGETNTITVHVDEADAGLTAGNIYVNDGTDQNNSDPSKPVGTVSPDTTTGTAATVEDVANAVNNSGFTVTGNGENTTLVNAGDKVDFTNGTGTTASVITKGNVTTVKFDVNTATKPNINDKGSVDVPDTNGGDFVNATTLAETINGVSWTAKRGESVTTNKDEGDADSKIAAGDSVTFVAGKNMALQKDGEKFIYATKDDVTFSNVTATNITVPTTPAQPGTDAKPVTINANGISAGDKPITNVSSALTNYADAPRTTLANLSTAPATNAATVGDLQRMGWIVSSDKTTGDLTNKFENAVTNAKEVKFIGTGAATVSGKLDGETNTITVHVDEADAGLTAGNIYVNDGTDQNNSDPSKPVGTVSPDTTTGTAATVEDVANAVNNSGFTVTGNGENTTLVNAGDKVDFTNGTGTTASVITKGNVTTVKFDVNTATKPNINDKGSVDVPDTNGGDFVNATTLAETINGVSWTAKRGESVTTNKDEGDADSKIAAGDSVTFVAGKNMALQKDGEKFIYATKDDVTFSNVTATNITVPTTPAQPGTDAKPVTINANGISAGDKPITNVSSALTNYADAPRTTLANLSTAPATNAATVGDLQRMGWIVSSDKTTGDLTNKFENAVTNAKEVKFIGTGAATVSGKLDGETNTITVHVDEADAGLTAGNIYVNDGTDQNNSDPSKPVGTVSPDTTTGTAATVEDVANAVNNSGFTVTGNGENTTLVNAGDKVDFTNGTGTTASVITKGNVTTVKFDVNTATKPNINDKGSVDVPDTNGGDFVNATTLAETINGVSWTAKRGESVTTNKDEGDADSKIAAGDSVTFVAGKNMALQKDGEKFIYATKDDVTFSNVTATNITVPTTPAQPGTDAKPVTINANGISAGDKPITNVSSALTNYADAPRTTLANLSTAPATNAATVGDLQRMGWIVSSDKTTGDLTNKFENAVTNAKEVKFIGTGAATVSGKLDGETNTITVHVDEADAGLTAGNIYVNDGTDQNNSDPSKPVGTVSPDTTTGTAATVEDVANAVNNSGFTVTGNGENTTLVNAGDKVDFTNGTGTTASVITKGNVTTVKFDVNTATKPNINDKGSVDVPDTNGGDFVNATTLAETINGVSWTAKRGESVTTNKDEGDADSKIAAGDSVTFVAGKNMALQKDGEKFIYATKDDVTFSNVTATNITVPTTPAQPGTDAKPVTINANGISAGDKPITNVSSALTNYADAPRTTLANLSTAPATNAATVGDLQRMGWIVSSDKTTGDLTNKFENAVTNAKEVKFIGTGAATVSGKLDGETNTITVHVDEADAGLTAGNIYVNDGTDQNNSDPSKPVGTVSPDTTTGTAATVEDVANAVNNSGFTVTGNGENTTLVNAGDKVDFTNGTGTTASVITKGNVTTVKFDVNTATKPNINDKGSVDVPDTNGGDFVNATTLAETINGVSWTAKRGESVTTNKDEGDADSKIAAGDSVTFVAGKNMALQKDGEKFIYATKDDVTFSNVTATNITVPTTPAQPGTDAKPVTINANGISAGDKPITNVSSALTNYADAPRTTLANLSTAPATNAATVGDLQRMGWIVSSDKTTGDLTNKFENAVTNAKEVKFIGTGAATVSGKLDGETNTITVHVDEADAGLTAGNIYVNDGTDQNNSDPSKPVGTVSPDTTTGTAATVEDVANAVNNSGFTVTGNGENTTLVNAGDKVDFTNGTGTTASVITKGNVTTVKFDVNTATKPNINDKGSVDVPDTNGGDFVNATTLAETINGVSWTAKRGESVTTNKDEGDADSKIAAGDSVTFVAGKNMALQKDGEKFIYATKDDVTFSNVNTTTLSVGNTSQPGAPVVNFVAEAPKPATNNAEAPTTALNITSADGKPTQITGVGSSLNKQDIATNPYTGGQSTPSTATLVNLTEPGINPNAVATVGDLQNMGWTVSAGNGYKDAVKNADEVKFVGAGSATVSGTTADGVRTITIDVKAPEAAQLPVVYTNKEGDKIVKVGDDYYKAGDVENGAPKPGVEKVEPQNIIASMNDINNDSKTPTTLTNVLGNLAPAYNVDSLTEGSNKKLTDTPATTEQVTKSADAPTGTDLKNIYNNAATVGDVLNAGFNLQENGTAKDFVKAYDTVNFVNGTGTTAAVEVVEGGKVANVTFNVNKAEVTLPTAGTPTPADDNKVTFNEAGKVVAPQNATVAGNTFLTTGDVANVVNNSGWTTTTTGANPEGVVINPGDTVNYVNGTGTTASVVKNDKGGVDVTYNLNTTNSSTINVTKNPDDSVKFDANTTTATATDGKVAPVGNTGDNLMNATEITNAVNMAGWTANVAKTGTGTMEDKGGDKLVNPGDSVTLTAGDNIKLVKDGLNYTVATNENVTFNNVNTTTLSVGNTTQAGSPVVNFKAEAAKPATNNAEAPSTALNITSADGKPTQITGVGSSLNTTNVPTMPKGDGVVTPVAEQPKLVDLTATTVNPNAVATVGDLQNMGWTVSAGENYKDAVKNANEVKFVAGSGITVTGETKDNIREIKIETNAQSLTNNSQLPVVYTLANGTKVYKNPNPQATDGSDAFTTEPDGKGTPHKAGDVIASMNNADNTTATPTQLANVKGNLAPTYNTGDYNVVDHKPTNDKAAAPTTGAGTEATPTTVKAPTPDEVKAMYNNAATVGDVLNAGFNLQENGTAKDFVKAYDTVNFVNGTGTTANVTMSDDGKVANVTYNVNVDESTMTTKEVKVQDPVSGKEVTNTVITANTTPLTTENGKVKEPAEADKPKLVNATTVADAINNSGFLATSDKVGSGVNTGTSNELVNPGDTVKFIAGDNINIKQDKGDFTISTSHAPQFENSLTVGGGAVDADGKPLVKVGDNYYNAGDVENGAPKDNAIPVQPAGTNKAPAVTFVAEAAKPATNNAEAPSTALNITSADGKPTQITGVGSSLNTTNVPTMPKGDGVVTPVAEQPKLVDLTATTVNPNAVATVGDLQNMGWTVSAGENYKDAVKNANEVKFVAGSGITVTGETKDNIREIKIETNAQSLTNNSQLPVVYTLANGTKVYKNPNPQATDGSDAFTTEPDGKGTPHKAGDVIASMNNADNTTATPTQLANVKGNLAPTYNTGDYNVVDHKPTNDKAAAPTTGAGTEATPTTVKAPTPDEVKAMYNNAATVGDVLNAGFNLQENGTAKDFVKAYDTVNFVNGTGTTANVTMSDDGKVANVTFNSALAYTDNNGNTTDASGKPMTPTNSVKLVGGDKDAPVTITGATSGLTPTAVPTFPQGQPTTGTPVTPVTANLINFDNNPASRIPDSTVATVGDLRNMGWVVSTSKGNGYSDAVRSSNEVDFVGAMGVTVTGETVNGKRVITISGGNNGGSAVLAGDNVKVDSQSTTNPDGTTSTNYTVSAPTAPITNNANGAVNVPTTAGLANATDVANAINNSGWNLQANGANGTLVNPSDTVSFNNGDNINITKNGNNVTVETTKDINVRGNLTVAGNTTLGNTEFRPNSTINAGNNQITNVAPGDVSADSKDAVNGSQLYQAYQVLGGNNQNITTVNPAPVTNNGGTTVGGTTTGGNTGGTTVGGTTATGDLVISAAPNSNVTVTSNNVTNVPTSHEYTMVTYNVEGQKNYITNNVIEAIGRINEQGIQFFHTNDGTGKPRAIQGENNVDSSASGAYATAVGHRAEAAGTNAIAIGRDTKALGDTTISIGNGNIVTGNRSGAFGDPSTITSDDSYVLGNDNNVSTNATFVVGNNVNQTKDNSVFLGNSTAYSYATGTNATSVAELSTANTNLVKAVSEQSLANATLAVAVKAEDDLKKTNASAEDIAKAAQAVTVAQTAFDAANANLTTAQSVVNNARNVVKVSEDAAIANSIATNTGRTAGTSTALTSQKVAGLTEDNKFAGGDQVVGVVSVGSDTETRRIQNVAPGLLSEQSTDAINGSQLYAVAGNLQNQIEENAARTVTVKKDGQDVATGNTVNFANGTGTVVNVSPYTQISTGHAVTKVTDPTTGAVTYTKQDGTTVDASDVDDTPTVIVHTAVAYNNADGSNNSGNTAKLVGAKEGDNVQLGNVASGVAVKNEAGDLVTPTNIPQAVYNATGPTLNNAASIGDIKAVAGDIHNRIDDVVDDANAGISSAMAAASLPQAYLPGKSMLTGGVASYNGQGAVAVGMSKLSDNGRWVLKLHGSADTRGNVGGAVGAGFHF